MKFIWLIKAENHFHKLRQSGLRRIKYKVKYFIIQVFGAFKMSFLNELIKKKEKLKSSQTVVTSIDGSRYLEMKSQAGILEISKLPDTCPGFVVDEKLDLQIAKVLEYLYLSSQDVAQDFDLLKKHEITHVLSVGVHLPTPNSCGIKFKSVELLDEPTADVSKILASCFDFIANARYENENNKILVHCNAGYSRAPTVLIAYLMAKCGYSYDESFKMVNENRNIKPNVGFINQLRNFKKSA